MTWDVASRLTLWALAAYVLWFIGWPLWLAILMTATGFLRARLADEDDV